MEKYFKNCTTSLADFYHHPLSYISDLINPLTDIKWFLKPNFKQEPVSDAQEICTVKPPFNELNLPENNPVYITNMYWKHRNNVDRYKIIANSHIRPNTPDECWEQCSTQSKTLVEEIERLERMIRDLSHPTELASLHEQKSTVRSQTENKKVQASIHNNNKNNTCVCGLPKSADNFDSHGMRSEINRSQKMKSQTEPKRSKSKLKSFSKQKQSKVIFGDDDFSVVVSKGRKKDKSTVFDVASKPSQNKDDMQEIYSTPSSTGVYPVAPKQSIQKNDKKLQSSIAIKPQEALICAQCGGAGEAIIKNRHTCHNSCCSHRGRGLCYHNYITLPVEKSKTDDKTLQNLSNELERQKAELQRVKDTLKDLIKSRTLEKREACSCPKTSHHGTYAEREVRPSPRTYEEREVCPGPRTYGEREVCFCPYRNKSPVTIVPEKRYDDVGVSQTTGELIREDVAEENSAPTNTADEKMTFSMTSQTSTEKKKCFKCKSREKKAVPKKKKCFWRCCC